MSVIIVHSNCSDVGIMALYPDTDEGIEKATHDMRKHAIEAFEQTELLDEFECIAMRRVKLPSMIENIFDTPKLDGLIMTVKTLLRTYDDVRDSYRKTYKKWKMEECRRELSDDCRNKTYDDEIDQDTLDAEIEQEIDAICEESDD